MLIFASDKGFGLFDIVTRVLEGNTTVGRKVEVFYIVIATIHGIFFLWLGRAGLRPFLLPLFFECVSS
jgi:hypothetical protein